MRDLTQHLTTRADDSHAAPVFYPAEPTLPSLGNMIDMSRPGKVLRVVELNHMLHRLCGLPSIPLSFNLAAVLPRRYTSRVSYATEIYDPNGKYTSLTAWTTRVSNPVCSPRCRVSVSVCVQKAACAIGIPPNTYEFHLYTGNSAFLSTTLV